MQKNIFFLMILMLGIATSGFGQFNVTHVTDQNISTAQNGFFYSLPRTVLEVNVVYEKIQQTRGPLADYAQDYLGTTDFITSNNAKYRIIDVQVNTTVEADPDQLYYVQFPAEKSKDEKEVVFHLSSIGTILAFDELENIKTESHERYVDQTFIMLEDEDGFKYQADYHRKKKIDTITRRITIDTVSIERFVFKSSWVDKSTEDKAEEAAQQISRIRESQFNLLTGYQEVNYGESIAFMDRELRKLENQYLELFLGKESKTIESQTVYHLPSKDAANSVLVSLPDGSRVNIAINPENITAKLPQVPLTKTGNIYYRIPDKAIVGISHDGQNYFQKRMIINQYGVTAAVPLNSGRGQFDAKTGSLIKVIRE